MYLWLNNYILVQIVEAIKYENGIFQSVEDALTVEEMLSIAINGNPYTITMRSPGFEEALTRGILLSEDVYHGNNHPIFSVIETNQKGYITKVNVAIPQEEIEDGIHTKRNLMSVTSCGMCGKEDTHLELAGEKLTPKIALAPATILDFFQKMSLEQKLFKKTGGSHAAAIFDTNNNLQVAMEDIGRHNAVDKAIGSLLLKNELSNALCLIVSGRISYEIVSKCYKAKIPYLAAVSAPSSLAVDFCKEKGITLLGFCRDNKLTQYC
jgi:FdhD protein